MSTTFSILISFLVLMQYLLSSLILNWQLITLLSGLCEQNTSSISGCFNFNLNSPPKLFSLFNLLLYIPNWYKPFLQLPLAI